MSGKVTWVSIPIEEAYDSFGRRIRRLSLSEERVMRISEGDVNRVRDRHGDEFEAVFYAEGNSSYWLPCDEDGEPLPDSDAVEVVAVLV